MTALKALRMNGLGNQFLVLDARKGALFWTAELVRYVCDPKHGPGYDQLIVLEPSTKADIFMRMWNADGSQTGACGNATRCVGWMLMNELKRPEVEIETIAGVLKAYETGDAHITVDMGRPRLDWREIPLANPQNTSHMDLVISPRLHNPAAVSMGNPHMVFFVPDVDAIDVARFGSELEHHALYPERANVGFAEIRGPQEIRLRVWERGAGLTKACGTGACAALVAASRRGLTDRFARVILDGGELDIDWRAHDDHVMMTGEVAIEGEVDLLLPV